MVEAVPVEAVPVEVVPVEVVPVLPDGVEVRWTYTEEQLGATRHCVTTSHAQVEGEMLWFKVVLPVVAL